MDTKPETPQHTVQEIAQYFIHLSHKAGKQITNKKLQKLVYYAQAWSLVLENRELFKEPIEAWVHGPAVRSLYSKYKTFGYNAITEEFDGDKVERAVGDSKKLLDQVWNIYGSLDARYLEMLTHSEEPWRQAREGLQGDEISSNEITAESMKKYYSNKLKEAQKQK